MSEDGMVEFRIGKAYAHFAIQELDDAERLTFLILSVVQILRRGLKEK